MSWHSTLSCWLCTAVGRACIGAIEKSGQTQRAQKPMTLCNTAFGNHEPRRHADLGSPASPAGEPSAPRTNLRNATSRAKDWQRHAAAVDTAARYWQLHHGPRSCATLVQITTSAPFPQTARCPRAPSPPPICVVHAPALPRKDRSNDRRTGVPRRRSKQPPHALQADIIPT